MFVQYTLSALAAAALVVAQRPGQYGPPAAYCPPSCATPSNLTTTQNVTVSDCTSTRWGGRTSTITTTATAQPTQCPYRITITAAASSCSSNGTVTTTAAPTACPYRITETTTLTAIQNYTSTLIQNATSTLTQNSTSYVTQNFTTTAVSTVTVTTTPSASSPTTPAYTGPFIEVLTFASSNCSNAGAVSEGYPTDIDSYLLTIDSTSNSSECTKFTSPVGSIEFIVLGTRYLTACYLNFYGSDLCVSDELSQVAVDVQDDQCWTFDAPRSMRIFCSGS